MNLQAFNKFTTAVVVITLMYSCSITKNTSSKVAKVNITSTKTELPGQGSVIFTQKKDRVEMSLELNFPLKANKTVAVHIHEHGDCGNAGNDAHGHWNPTKNAHGKWDSAQFHLGDIGNIQLDASGKGIFKITTDKWSIGTGGINDIVGKGLIVHDGVDDYTTQPTGNAGSRIGCGVITIF